MNLKKRKKSRKLSEYFLKISARGVILYENYFKKSFLKYFISKRLKVSGGVAQVVEQRTHKPRVGGSNPSTATN